MDNLNSIIDRSKIGGKHTIPISTSFNLLKYFTVSPSINSMRFGISRSLAIIIMSLKMELKSILQIHFREHGHIHLHLHYLLEFMEQYSLKRVK